MPAAYDSGQAYASGLTYLGRLEAVGEHLEDESGPVEGEGARREHQRAMDVSLDAGQRTVTITARIGRPFVRVGTRPLGQLPRRCPAQLPLPGRFTD